MLQSLLEDRFRLKLRRGAKEVPVEQINHARKSIDKVKPVSTSRTC